MIILCILQPIVNSILFKKLTNLIISISYFVCTIVPISFSNTQNHFFNGFIEYVNIVLIYVNS